LCPKTAALKDIGNIIKLRDFFSRLSKKKSKKEEEQDRRATFPIEIVKMLLFGAQVYCKFAYPGLQFLAVTFW